MSKLGLGLSLAVGVGLVALLGAAPEARAQGFRMVSDGPESVWVLDDRTGAVTWCHLDRPSGPKVIDVFGDATETRARREGAPSPECTTALGPQRVPRLGLRELFLARRFDQRFDADFDRFDY